MVYQTENELELYKHMATVSSTSQHPGRHFVRTLLDSFKLTGPDGEHQCLVHPPLWNSVKSVVARQTTGRLSPYALRLVLRRLLSALDFIHTECHLIHTGEFDSPYPTTK